MNSIFGLMATSGGNFVSIAHLEIPLLIKMLMCQILIFPAVSPPSSHLLKMKQITVWNGRMPDGGVVQAVTTSTAVK